MKLRSGQVLGGRFKRIGWLAVLLAMVAMAPSLARAQGDAAISGTISDPTGSAVAAANVKITNLETGAVRNVIADDAGRYEAPFLPVGSYDILAEKPGFRPTKISITLVIGQRATLNVKLSVAEVQQTIQVQEAALSESVTNTDVSGLVSERQVKDLPLNGRSYDQLLTLNPGVVNYTSQRAGGNGASNSVIGNMFSASGRRPQENLYLLNGVEYTSASEVNNTPGGVSGQLLGVEAVREFSVVKDTYGAEYGKRPGAQINIVTASGTNQLHGNVYEFLRNSAFDARNFFDHGSIPQFQRNVFGASLGGPVKRDKSFLFGNYEGFRQTLGLSDLTLEPDAAQQATAVASIRPLLALWPAITGTNSQELLTSTGVPSGIAEVFTNPVQHIREDFGTVRFDQTFSDKDSFASIYTFDDSVGHTPTTNPITSVNVFLREQVASLSETHIFSPSLINRATFGFSRGAFYFNSGTTVPLPGWLNPTLPIGALVVGGGTTLNGASQITNAGTNAGSNLRAVRNLFTYTDQVTFTRGRHLIEMGVWIEQIQANDTLIQDQYGQASFSNLSSFLKGTVSTYTFAPSLTPLNWRSLEGAFYLQDTIKVKPSLEIIAGFRGESTNGWNEAHGRASNYVFDSNGVIVTQPVVGNSALGANNAKFLPAPRIGIAWAPTASKKTVIRAGFGIYYALLDNLSYRLDQNPPYNSVYAIKNISYSSISTTNASTPGAFVVPSGVQPGLLTPTVESYTLKVERQLPASTAFGRGLHRFARLPRIALERCKFAQRVPSPYPTQVITSTSTGLANPNVWNTTHWFSGGVSSYNGLEVDVNHRSSHGLQFRGVYTFSKTLDDGDNMNTSVATNSPAFVANPLDPKADYGRAAFDVKHSGVINATYDLPFGRRKTSAPWVNKLIGDWQISGIETIQSGLPFTPQLSYNPSNDGDTRNPVRPDVNSAFTGSIIQGGTNQYFNPLAFIQPAAGPYGNAGRNILEGAGLATTDLSLAKRLPLSERLNVQFRAELFNIFNRTNFNNPNPVVYGAATPVLSPSPTAGVITSTSTSSRQVQFGLKLLW